MSHRSTDRPRGTGLLPEQDRPPQPVVKPFYTGTPLAGWQIRLFVGTDETRPLTIDVSERVLVGRPDSLEGFTPEVDLTPFGGRDRGVSRRHAEFVVIDNQLYLRDLGSTNGTRLNRNLLHPNQLYRLADGDLIECGQLPMVLKLR